MDKIIILILMLISCVIVPLAEGNSNNEISVESAIQIASDTAKKENFNIQEADIEVLKVKNKIERGPIRLVWLLKYFTTEEQQVLLNNEFWIVYFYPKGLLQTPQLGGDFCVLVELYTGKVLKSLEFQ